MPDFSFFFFSISLANGISVVILCHREFDNYKFETDKIIFFKKNIENFCDSVGDRLCRLGPLLPILLSVLFTVKIKLKVF